ncbi:SCP domain-containing protein [Trichostrongylus colubriformis]|uniref:SCP domain-containing protein n=1 Tax=Trichostrongylus colubriformis TaxID=6319 RepID=A0AAN8IN79_TRICO
MILLLTIFALIHGTIGQPAQAPPTSITQSIRDKVISMHNYRRSRLAQGFVPNGVNGMKFLPKGSNIYYLKYNRTLENAAQQYADGCPTTGSSNTTRNDTGENFAIVPSTTMTYYDAVINATKQFWREVKRGAGIIDTTTLLYFSNMSGTLSRFTQMAWASTYEVGCGARICPRNSNTVVVCRYSPRGNIPNTRIYQLGEKCGTCPSNCVTAYNYQGLCNPP